MLFEWVQIGALTLGPSGQSSAELTVLHRTGREVRGKRGGEENQKAELVKEREEQTERVRQRKLPSPTQSLRQRSSETEGVNQAQAEPAGLHRKWGSPRRDPRKQDAILWHFVNGHVQETPLMKQSAVVSNLSVSPVSSVSSVSPVFSVSPAALSVPADGSAVRQYHVVTLPEQVPVMLWTAAPQLLRSSLDKSAAPSVLLRYTTPVPFVSMTH
ncbi:hypothetical protein EYF80_011856 [Liparis tanakae]|uniref:Uncharacterized protein n=1 Tax=Liparis tanakae TaxID=230148 RepID=A0A4Z2IL74_9TELE|nr:hypothetical protein EYF80_011856 [Liparis tanakae]